MAVDGDAERIDHVRTAKTRLAGYRPVAVFGHTHTRAGNHERRHSGNVEGASAIASRAAGVEDGFAGQVNIDRRGRLALGAGKADEFIHGFALHSQRHQEPGDLGQATPCRRESFAWPTGLPRRKDCRPRRDVPDRVKELPELPDGSVDFVLTDPPYLVDYRSRDGRSIAGDESGQWLKPAFAQLSRAESWRLLRQLLRLE